MTIDSGRGRPGPTWSHKLVSGRIPAIKRRLPEDDLRGAHPKVHFAASTYAFRQTSCQLYCFLGKYMSLPPWRWTIDALGGYGIFISGLF